MAKICIAQKLGLDNFKVLNSQFRATGVHIIRKPEQGPVAMEHVLGRLQSVFNLGKKLEVVIPDSVNHFSPDRLRFEKLDGVYYLVRSDK